MKIDHETYKVYMVLILRMWCDNVLKDAEYRRITERLQKMKQKEEKDE